MSWFFASNSKNLPNGQAPPCFHCGKVKCECQLVAASALPGVQQAVLAPVQPVAAGNATSSSVDVGAANDGAAKTKAVSKKTAAPNRAVTENITGKKCNSCGESEPRECICPDVVTQRETKFRQLATIDERIDSMVAFCSDLQKTIGDEDTHREYTLIQERGACLTAQYEVIQQYLERGVVTGALAARHMEEVDNWMKRCDEFNVALCSMGSEKLMIRRIDVVASNSATTANDDVD